nr:hypothetical protein [Nanoarchaeota archaeon]
MTYKVIINLQKFEYEDMQGARTKVKELLDAGLWFIELTEEKPKEEIKEDDTSNDIEKDIEDDIEKPKKPTRKEFGGRPSRYPKELFEFIKNNMESKGNIALAEAINQKFDLDITPAKLASYMSYNRLKRKHRVYSFRNKEQIKRKGVLKKRTKLFPEEVDDYIEKNWETNADAELVVLLINKFNREYTVDQIKSHRKEHRWVGSK